MQKYRAVFLFAFQHALKNYRALIGLSIFLITCLVIFAHLWKVGAMRMGSFGLDPKELLWYTAFNQWVLIAMPDMHEDMEQDLKSGKLAYLLPRPISYLGSTFMEGLGALSARLLVLGVVSFSFTWIRSEGMPFDLISFPFLIAVGFLSGCVGILFKMAIGVSAFWLHQVEPFHWVWEKMLFMLGGLMLPLTIYPEWLQKIARFTPFPAILGDRSSMAIHFTWAHLFILTLLLVFWGLIAASLTTFLYRKSLKIVHIEGG